MSEVTAVEPDSAETEKKAGPIRRMYDWVVGWADTPYGGWALFLIALAEASVFPIPPDVLLLALAFGAPKKSFRFALICAAGSIVGAIVGYVIGVFFFDTVGMWVIETYGLQEKMSIVKGYYTDDRAFWALLAAGFTPIPFKVFTIISGMMGTSLLVLVLASAISRTARFMLVATVVYLLGDKAKEFIDKYFDYLTIGFTVLLIGGFVALKYLF